MPKTLLQTILAAFCAILFASSVEGGRVMNIGARMACWSGGKISAKSYVQDGLIAMWDGIENAGWGTHDASAITWIDLIDGRELTLANNSSFDENKLVSGVSVFQAGNSGFCAQGQTFPSYTTIECVFDYSYLGNNRLVCPGISAAYQISKYARTSKWGASVIFSSGKGVWNIRDEEGLQSVSAVYRTSTPEAWANGTLAEPVPYGDTWSQPTGEALLYNERNFGFYSLRLYNRALTASEIATNYRVDKARFGLT